MTAGWDHRLSCELSECWLKLSCGQTDGILDTIANLRRDQKDCEKKHLDKYQNSVYNVRAEALHLIALYHWARATELLTTFLLQGQYENIEDEINKQFNFAKRAIINTFDVTLEIRLDWFHTLAMRMIEKETQK